MTIDDPRVKQARSAVLELPSAIILGASNFQLNTCHPDFKSITLGKPDPFSFDSQLLQRVKRRNIEMRNPTPLRRAP